MKKILFFLILLLIVGCIKIQKQSIPQTEQKDWWLWAANWHPNANQIVVGGTQDTLRLFSANIKWSANGDLLATASEKLRLWDKNGDLVLEKPVPNLLWGIDWNSDDSKLITTDGKGLIQVWNRKLKKIDELKY